MRSDARSLSLAAMRRTKSYAASVAERRDQSAAADATDDYDAVRNTVRADEPYEAAAESSYEVYDYDNGCEPADRDRDCRWRRKSRRASRMRTDVIRTGMATSTTTSITRSTARTIQPTKSAESAAVEADSPQDADVLQLGGFGT